MSNAGGSAPPQARDQYRDAIDGYRGIVRWVISSFGAVAAALIVGVQLTSLGQLHGGRLTWSIISLALAFVAVLAIIFAAVRVLVPVGGTFREFESGREFAALRDLLQRDPAPLRGKAITAGGLAGEYERAMANEADAWSRHQADPTNPTLEAAYGEARLVRANLFETVRSVTSLGLYLRTKQLFQVSMRTIYFGVTVAAAASIVFAYASKPPKTTGTTTSTTEIQAILLGNTDCVRYYVELDELADDEPRLLRGRTVQPAYLEARRCGIGTERALRRLVASLARR